MGLYLVQSFKGANIFVKLAFIFLAFGMLFGWIAFTTADWCRTFPTQNDDYYKGYGIWRNGDNSEPYGAGSVEHNDGWLLPWYGAFQAFATFGFIGLNVAFFLIVLYMFVGPCKSNGDLGFWNAINCLFTGICWLIAIILFGAKYKSLDPGNYDEAHVSYSFVFAIFTLILQVVAGVFLLLTGRGGGAVGESQQRTQQQHGKK